MKGIRGERGRYHSLAESEEGGYSNVPLIKTHADRGQKLIGERERNRGQKDVLQGGRRRITRPLEHPTHKGWVSKIEHLGQNSGDPHPQTEGGRGVMGRSVFKEKRDWTTGGSVGTMPAS